MNTGEGREFIQEDVEICSDRYIITTSRTKVNGTGELEASPKETSVFSYPRENGDEGLTTFDDESEISLFKATAPTPYSKTISLRGAKFTVASVATLIASVLGVSSAGAFVKVASVMISYWIGAGTNVVPDSVYFSGTRTVSKSSGKIFNRYKGTFYADSSMRKSFASASWSKRWGH